MYDNSNSVGIVDEELLFALNDSKGVHSSYFRKENNKQRLYTLDVMGGITVILIPCLSVLSGMDLI